MDISQSETHLSIVVLTPRCSPWVPRLEDFQSLRELVDTLPREAPGLAELGAMFESVGLAEDAVRALLRLGNPKAAIDACVRLNHWERYIKHRSELRCPSVGVRGITSPCVIVVGTSIRQTLQTCGVLRVSLVRRCVRLVRFPRRKGFPRMELETISLSSHSPLAGTRRTYAPRGSLQHCSGNGSFPLIICILGGVDSPVPSFEFDRGWLLNAGELILTVVCPVQTRLIQRFMGNLLEHHSRYCH